MKPVIVKFEIPEKLLKLAAASYINYFWEDFDSEAIELLGIDDADLVNDLVAWPQFHQEMIGHVREYGLVNLEDDPTEFYNRCSPQFEQKMDLALGQYVRELEKIYNDALKPSTNAVCAEAIEMLAKAGFKVVKA